MFAVQGYADAGPACLIAMSTAFRLWLSDPDFVHAEVTSFAKSQIRQRTSGLWTLNTDSAYQNIVSAHLMF